MSAPHVELECRLDAELERRLAVLDRLTVDQRAAVLGSLAASAPLCDFEAAVTLAASIAPATTSA